MAHWQAFHAHIRLLIFCVVIQQTGTFWGVGTQGGAYDPQIRSRAKFLYNASNCQVSSSDV